MGKLRVYCLKTLNKLSIYPVGNTPSAPSDKFFRQLNRQQSDIDALKDWAERLELRVRVLELENKLLSAHMNSMADKLCFCTRVEVTSQVDSFVILAWLRKGWCYLLAWPCRIRVWVCRWVIGSYLIFWGLRQAKCFQSTHSWTSDRCSHHGTDTSDWWDVPVLFRLWGPEWTSDWTGSHRRGSSGCTPMWQSGPRCEDGNSAFWSACLSWRSFWLLRIWGCCSYATFLSPKTWIPRPMWTRAELSQTICQAQTRRRGDWRWGIHKQFLLCWGVPVWGGLQEKWAPHSQWGVRLISLG